MGLRHVSACTSSYTWVHSSLNIYFRHSQPLSKFVEHIPYLCRWCWLSCIGFDIYYLPSNVVWGCLYRVYSMHGLLESFAETEGYVRLFLSVRPSHHLSIYVIWYTYHTHHTSSPQKSLMASLEEVGACTTSYIWVHTHLTGESMYRQAFVWGDSDYFTIVYLVLAVVHWSGDIYYQLSDTVQGCMHRVYSMHGLSSEIWKICQKNRFLLMYIPCPPYMESLD
jgi:hypothetical protein